jgi:hypothetical protein
MNRVTWKFYYISRNVFPEGRLLKYLLNMIWALSAIAWEESREFSATSKLKTTIDHARPRNVSDAVANLAASSYVCDFGGGSGHISNELLSRGVRVVYTDTNLDYLNLVSQKFKNYKTFDTCAVDDILNGSKGIFDYLILSHVLEHIENPIEFLNKVSKICRNIHVEVPDLRSNPLNFLRIELGLPTYMDDDHIVEMSSDYLQYLLMQSNFKVDSIECRDGMIVSRAQSTSGY